MLFLRNHGKCRVTRIRRQFSRCGFRSCFPPCQYEVQRKYRNSIGFCIWEGSCSPMKAPIPRNGTPSRARSSPTGRWNERTDEEEDHSAQCCVPIERTFLWSDCTTVLQWLLSIDKIPVTEILELTTVDERNHVPKVDKPVDAGTRGLSVNAPF